jgi:hypothetical protein
VQSRLALIDPAPKRRKETLNNLKNFDHFIPQQKSAKRNRSLSQSPKRRPSGRLGCPNPKWKLLQSLPAAHGRRRSNLADAA